MIDIKYQIGSRNTLFKQRTMVLYITIITMPLRIILGVENNSLDKHPIQSCKLISIVILSLFETSFGQFKLIFINNNFIQHILIIRTLALK